MSKKVHFITVLIIVLLVGTIFLANLSRKAKLISIINGKGILVGNSVTLAPGMPETYQLFSPKRISISQMVSYNSKKYHANYKGKVDGGGFILKTHPKETIKYQIICMPIWKLMSRQNIFGQTTEFIELDYVSFSYRSININPSGNPSGSPSGSATQIKNVNN